LKFQHLKADFVMFLFT